VNSYRKRLKQIYPDCWQWISLARRFPGQLTENEAASLFQLARARTPFVDPAIVELGACRGKSTLLLAAGLRGKTRSRLFSFPGISDSGDGARNFQRCRLEHIVDIMMLDSRDAAASWNTGIDILFISATDDNDTLRSHLSLWSPFVRAGGIVALHGASAQSRALLLPASHYSDFRHVDGLAWAVKQCGDAAQQEMSSAKLQDFVGRAARERAEHRHALQALRRSWSWRLTAPLRLGIETLDAIGGVVSSFGHGSPKTRMIGLAQWLWFGRQIRSSGLLDEHFYRDTHAGVGWARSSPLLHFFVLGASEGNQPNALFDIEYYRGRYPDVAQSAMNPLVHYLRSGAYEGRDPHPHFDSSFYLEQNPDVREGRFNPLAHYLAPGIAEGRDPNPWFDTSEYLEQNPDVAVFGLNPLAHQAEIGSKS
jgi:predicted O-methyltransferase YrrM